VYDNGTKLKIKTIVDAMFLNTPGGIAFGKISIHRSLFYTVKNLQLYGSSI
jgi:hypothetical protein